MIRKYFYLALLFLLPMQEIFSQDCTLQRTTDDFSGQPKISTGFMDIQGIDFSIDATAKEIDYTFIIRNPAANCISAESEAQFLFEGGKTKLELRNTGGDNCNGFFHILLKGGQFTPSAMQKFSTKKVVAITFTDRNAKKTTVSLTPDQQVQFQKMTVCVAVEVKKL